MAFCANGAHAKYQRVCSPRALTNPATRLTPKTYGSHLNVVAIATMFATTVNQDAPNNIHCPN